MTFNPEKYSEARKILLRFVADQAKEKGITQEDIAERTGFSRSNVSRMLAGRFAPTLDNFIRLAEAVEVYFFLESKDAKSENAEFMRDRHKRPDDEN